MKDLTPLGMRTALAAAIALASGTAFAQPQETRSETTQQRADAQEQWQQKREPVQQQQQPPQQRQSEALGVDDEDPLHDNPDVESSDFEEGMVTDGQHGDHLHWSHGTMPQHRLHSNGLMGSNVLSRDNEVLGQVVDLILDEEDRILALIVEVGEEMGLGARKVAIPWHALQPVRAGEQEFHLVVDTDPERLPDAAEYERD
jgi:sporulation protein YlmC with PRC-barrel domain